MAEAECLVVVLVGVYDQGVVGITSSMEEAKRIAERAAAQEDDTYHAFEIRRRREGGDEFDWAVTTFTAGGRIGLRNRGGTQPRGWVSIG